MNKVSLRKEIDSHLSDKYGWPAEPTVNDLKHNYKVAKNYVYIVYECDEWAKNKKDHIGGKIHGVYININEAEGKRWSLLNTPGAEGYIAVLKKPLQGKSLW